MNEETTVEFTGFIPEIGPTGEIGCWVNENFTLINEERVEEVKTDDYLGLPKAEETFPTNTLASYGNFDAIS